MTLFEACLAKPYGWLAILHSGLVHVGKSARIDGLKVIAMLIVVPVFEARYLLFQILYASQERRLRLARLKQFEPPIDDGVEKRGSLFPNLGRGLERVNALRKINRDLEAIRRCRDGGNINHSSPLIRGFRQSSGA